MQVFRSLEFAPQTLEKTVIAIGNFDGVHRGHQAIIEKVRDRARLLNAKSVAVTFDPHPVRVLRPDLAPKLITPLETRLELLAQTGLDATVVISFTKEFSQLSAHDFASQILVQSLKAAEVHEGDNFRFGHGASAGTPELTQLGRELGFNVIAQNALHVRGIPVSSSQIRQRIAAGDMTTARALLGRVFSIRSTQIRERGVGTRLTVPTINFAHYDELLPADGVYITKLRIGTEIFEAVTNAGKRPTFGELAHSIETHLLNFRPIDITPETPLELCFLQGIRGEKKFLTPELLKEQILKDVAQAKRYFRLMNVLLSKTPSF
jgi:riboflavin kinase / FMN adenylyltransferase